MFTLIKYFPILLIIPVITSANRCGSSWTEFKDEKCFQFVETFAVKKDAQDICQGLDSNSQLPIIKSQEEQDFINNLIYHVNGVLDGVWIGASRVESSTEFIWDNNDHMNFFTNWAPYMPSNTSAKVCVRMVSSLGKFQGNEKNVRVENGQWADIACGTRQFILCEKLQSYSENELFTELLRLRYEHENFVKKTTENIESIRENHDDFVNQTGTNIAKLIPVGFLYFQIGTQPAPSSMWPQYTWSDVSLDYAGLFFRVTGGGAAAIGQTQAENAPRLGSVNSGIIPRSNPKPPGSVNIPASGRSPNVFAGNDEGIVCWEYMNFQLTNVGEVRPKNTAMRVWKRSS